MNINPIPKRFIIFSGGGGIMERVQRVRLSTGINTFEIENVPASFDPSTATAFFGEEPEGVNILQVDVKRPDKQIVENFISREKTAASAIIQNATDLRGANRDQIIELIESAHYRRYEDMRGTLTVTIESRNECEAMLCVRYFLEDARIKWEPSLHLSIDENSGTATVEGFILAMNNSDINYPRCEVEFAEFEMQYTPGDEGFLNDLANEQVAQSVMPRNRMMKQMKRLKSLVK